ncbi:uncharacterized protein [Halyomorpha halys]|uniref:uncharacterized protein n=1 Tax=Halyomorpha halys TaxID=286706 RepID=UPI0006D4D259|nr:myoneurin-like [Halyomorpha halys]
MELSEPAILNVTSGTVGENFEVFKEETDMYMVATGTVIKPNEVQVERPKSLMGPKALKLNHSIQTYDEDKETVQSILNDSEACCFSKLRKNEIREMFKFFNRRQGPDEPFDRFYADLKSLIVKCDFKDQEDKLLKVQLLCGMKSVASRERLLGEDLSLEKMVDFCKSVELMRRKMEMIEPLGGKEDIFHLDRNSCNNDNGNKPSFRVISELGSFIEQEKTDDPVFDNRLIHVNHEVLLIPDDDVSNSGSFISEEKENETESTYVSDSVSFISEGKENETESTCDQNLKGDISSQNDSVKDGYEAVTSPELSENVMNNKKEDECPCEPKSVKNCNLKSHMTGSQGGKKPHQCPHCKYITVKSSHLKTHIMARHTSEKPYQCPQCDYKATQNYHIKRHLMACHKHKKPHKCPHCDYRSSQLFNINSHIKYRHTIERPHQCPYCDYKAVSVSRIKRHQLACHSPD